MAIVIVAIVGTVSAMLLFQGTRSFERMDVRNDLFFSSRLVLERISREVRLARCTSGVNSCAPSASDITYPSAPLPASSSEFRFVNSSNEGRGFSLSGSSIMLRQGSGGGDPEDIIADNATGLQFEFLKSDGTVASAISEVWVINVTLTLSMKGDSLTTSSSVHPRAFY